MLIEGSALSVSPSGTPRILWDSVVTFSGITASSSATGYPASNLANPATNQEWRAGEPDSPAQGEEITIMMTSGTRSAVGIAGHNFGTAGIPVEVWGASSLSLDASTKLLLHFDGADASTTFTDEMGHTFTAVGNAQIDTSDYKFGGSAGLFDGSGDVIHTPDHADFTFGTGDFTVECWFKCTAPSGVTRMLFGQNAGGGTAGISIRAWRSNSTNRIVINVCIGANDHQFGGTLQFTDSLNTGWHHFAMVRTGTTLRSFIDGVLDASGAVNAGAVNDVSAAFAIGAETSGAANPWMGWIDEFRISHTARWTSAFTPPGAPYPYSLLAGPETPDDDEPILFHFPEQSLTSIVIALGVGTEPARAASVYAGNMLVMERGLDVGEDFAVPRFARKTEYAAPRSERGDYLGRIVTSQWIDDITHNYKHLTTDFFRDYIDPFIQGAQEDAPFFYAMKAEDGVNWDVAYLWLTDDPMPLKSPVTERYNVALKMGGVVG